MTRGWVALVFLFLFWRVFWGGCVGVFIFGFKAETFGWAEEVVDDGGAWWAKCDGERVGEVGDMADVLGGVMAPLG